MACADVAAHLLADETMLELGVLPWLARMAWFRFDIHKANAWWVDHCADWPTERLVERSAAAVVPGRVSRLTGAASQLRSVVVHHADMRIPLGRSSIIDPERVRLLLDVLPTPAGSVNVGSAERAAGLRLVATDLDWARGEGPDVRGPGMSLVLALAGRPVALPDLEGAGVPVLAERTRRPVAAASTGGVFRVLVRIRREAATERP